uniref:Uncharacterized protein n=1 Tax=Rhipicephalus zambeziensis TaxID=60191 RepID=A0A224YG24_9ACAR
MHRVVEGASSQNNKDIEKESTLRIFLLRAVRFLAPRVQCRCTRMFRLPFCYGIRCIRRVSSIVSKRVRVWCSSVCFGAVEGQMLQTLQAHTSKLEWRLPSMTVLFRHGTFTSSKENPCQMYVSILSLFFSVHAA